MKGKYVTTERKRKKKKKIVMIKPSLKEWISKVVQTGNNKSRNTAESGRKA